MPERDIESLGMMGKGAGGGQEILPPSPSSSPARPPEGPVGTGWIQGERSELRYVLASYWMPTLRVSSDDYSFRRTGVILDAYFKSMLPTFKGMLPTLRVCCLHLRVCCLHLRVCYLL